MYGGACHSFVTLTFFINYWPSIERLNECGERRNCEGPLKMPPCVPAGLGSQQTSGRRKTVNVVNHAKTRLELAVFGARIQHGSISSEADIN